MTEEYNPNVMDNYNRLKKKYENGFLEKSINFEENLTETNMKETMSNFNYLMKTKINELKTIKNKIDKMTEYRDSILGILKDMQSMEKKYIELFQKNTLDVNELKLEPPSYAGIQSILSGDLRGGLNVDNKPLPELIKKQLFTVNELYTNSMCEVCTKLDDKINEESIKMGRINDFIDVYKTTVSTFDLNKQFCNKYNCTICYENEVKVCFLPCGHTFCRGCSDRANRKCFVCNGVVTDTKTIFLLGGTSNLNDEDEEQIPTGAEPIAANQTTQNQRVHWNIFTR